jgi:hypothetical protein
MVELASTLPRATTCGIEGDFPFTLPQIFDTLRKDIHTAAQNTAIRAIGFNHSPANRIRTDIESKTAFRGNAEKVSGTCA